MNPLLAAGKLPDFAEIKPEHVVPAVEFTLKTIRKELRQLLSDGKTCTWNSLLVPLEKSLQRLHKVWSPVSHLNAVCNSAPLREAYNTCLPLISAFETELGQDQALFEAVQSIADSQAFTELSAEQQTSIKNRLRDFRLSGIALSARQREQYKQLQSRLSGLQSRFQENVLDATHAWKKSILDVELLSGLPDTAKSLMLQAARQKKLEGWLLTLDFPSYIAVMTYADDRKLRKEIYTAYVTRASDIGPYAGKWDNSEAIEEILSLRHQSAKLLGFSDFAERSLVTKMASTPEQVLKFLHDLASHSLERARSDVSDVQAFAESTGFSGTLQAWDVPYFSEKLRQQRYALSQEELKPYFADSRVLDGLFQVAQRLYGIKIIAGDATSTWHGDVRFYEIFDVDGSLCGQFYLDLYARPDKRGGAWMDDYSTRMSLDSETQLPVAYLVCNFAQPLGGQPSLLTHDEVITLFHEFGHGLHHMLSRVATPSVSGINGVAWDAVELPSQFMENWCWEREALDLFAVHYQTGESLPDYLFQRMQSARNFQSAMRMVRQLEFALFDMRIHHEYDPAIGSRISEILTEVRNQVSVIDVPHFNRFAHSFSHIFGGGYAAGYYSYKWAEVLSADAFSLFEEKGIFDAQTGLRFRSEVLSQGGAKDPMHLFTNFRGREPRIDALLRHSGLEPPPGEMH